MTNSKTSARQDAQRDDADLDGRYGEIGISAVAAAVQFRSETRNTEYGRGFQYDYD